MNAEEFQKAVKALAEKYELTDFIFAGTSKGRKGLHATYDGIPGSIVSMAAAVQAIFADQVMEGMAENAAAICPCESCVAERAANVPN